MQIYMPYSSIEVNVKILDDHTLNQQCARATAILGVLQNVEAERVVQGNYRGGWNPAIKMWGANQRFLGHYAHRLIAEWKSHKYPDHWSTEIVAMGHIKTPTVPTLPWWWDNEHVHDYHKACLYRLNPEWYGQFFQPDLDAIGWWPNIVPNSFMRGPKTQTGSFMIDGEHPVFDKVQDMKDSEFVEHANRYHKLQPDMISGVRANEGTTLLNMLRILHDRLHAEKVYVSHDHR